MFTTPGSRDYGRFDALAEEFAERYRRGERPSLQEYVDRLPEMAEEIREMFPALVEVERADGDARGDFVRPPAIAPRLGQVGDYRIVREIGRGGMGVVYEAEQVSLGRRVALKILPGHVTGDRQALERFRREAKSAARLHHTNIVPVFEVGRDRDVSFYAMQLIQGQGLDQVFEELRRLREPGRKTNGREPARSADPGVVVANDRPRVGATSILQKQALVQLTASLLTGRLVTEGPEESPRGAIVATGLAQTDRFDPAATSGFASDVPKCELPPALSASNLSSSAVMPGGKHVSEVDTSGRRQPFFRSVAQIGRQTAQGLAYAHTRGIVHRDIKPSNLLLDTEGVVWITDFGLAKDDDDGMTASGDILGTLRYMAPERFRGQGDARADIYALGLTLYELLTLRSAYDSSDRLRLIEQIKSEEPVRPRLIDPQIPRDLETIVLKAIDKHLDHRYPTAVALAEDLRRFLADEPIKARQISTSERYWRWARRNPVIAMLGGVLSAVLVMATIASLLMAARFAKLADDASNSAAAEHGARVEADGARIKAIEASKTAETARAAALAETYRSMLTEAKALRAGRQLGWRDEALADLARMAVIPTPGRNLAELRTEAVATLGEFSVTEVARFAVSGLRPYSIDFSPDSRTFVTACGDGNLDLWDFPARKHLRRLGGVASTGNNRSRTSGGLARFLHDGNLAYLNSRGAVAFVDRSARESTRPPIVRGKAKAIRLETDGLGRWLAVGWDDGHIDLHDGDTGSVRRSIDWNRESVFVLSPDGKWLALIGPGPANLVPTTPEGRAFDLQQGSGLYPSLAFSPDGAKLAAVEDRAVVVWDLASRRELLRLSGHRGVITAVAFSPDGALIATSCADTMTRIWDAHDGRPLTTLPGPWDMESVAFSPDGAYLAASAGWTPLVCFYQLKGMREQRRLIGHKFNVHRLVPHPSLPRFASGSNDHAVIVWDADSARELARSVVHDVYVTGLAIRPDGALIASTQGGGGKDPSILLTDATTGALKGRLVGNTTGVWTLAFDPTGRRIASGDRDGTVLLFEVETGKLLRRENLGNSKDTSLVFVDGGHSNISSLVFLDGGRSLLIGQVRGWLALIDLAGSAPTRRLLLPDGCTRLAVNRRGDRAIVGDTKGDLIELSLPDLQVVQRLEKAHEGVISALAWSPDGLLLASGGLDRRVVLRDPQTFQPLLTFPPWTGPLRDVALDSTGRWLGFAGAESEIALWDLDRVREGLAAVGLAWDRPDPRVVSSAELASIGDRPRPQVPVVKASGMEPAEYREAQRLLSSGIAAFQKGRFADAIVDLQAASERARALRNSSPDDPMLIRLHGTSLGFLAGSFRDSKRPREALARVREALAGYESIRDPNSLDLYNLACNCAMVSTLDEGATVEASENLQTRAVEYFRKAIAGDRTRYLAAAATDRDLDSVRGRADFRA